LLGKHQKPNRQVDVPLPNEVAEEDVKRRRHIGLAQCMMVCSPSRHVHLDPVRPASIRQGEKWQALRTTASPA
jgi:hypothetical protein